MSGLVPKISERRSRLRTGALTALLCALSLTACGGTAGGGPGDDLDGGAGTSGSKVRPVCPVWSPPDVPDGGFSPTAPEGGAITNGKPACPGTPQPATACSSPIPAATSADDRSAGFSAQDVLNDLNDPGAADLIWYDGTTTTLHMQARYENLSVSVAHGAPDGGSCWDEELTANGAVLAFSTDDGKLMGEELPAILGADVRDQQPRVVFAFSSLGLRLDVAALHGSFQLPASWTADAGMPGFLTLEVGSKGSPCNPNCAVGVAERWSDTVEACGYDGKIVANIPRASMCDFRLTVATWKWR
jgi:hypothetical protein